jgi:hypothetical protein
MSIRQKKIHSFFIGISFSIVAWLLVDNLLVEIALWKWVLIELGLGMMEYFCNFVKQSLGVEAVEPEDDKVNV